MLATPWRAELTPLPLLYAAALSGSSWSALTAAPALLFSPDWAALGLCESEADAIAEWLQAQPCPTLAIGPAGTDVDADARLLRAADLALASVNEAEPLLARIGHTPLAAAVLVQLLRATAALPLAAALLAESLAYSTLQAGPEFRRWSADHPPQALPVLDDGPAVAMHREGDALTLTLNRPRRRNAMSVEMRDALMEALQLVVADRSLTTVTLRGRGKCFSTGGELAEFGTAPDVATAHLVRSMALPGRLLAQCAGRVEAQLHGACIGSGIEFPAFAGRVMASPEAWFQLPELRFGLIPGAGGCVSITRRIGRQRTAWMVLSGARITADTALAWGLVDAVVPGLVKSDEA